MTPIAFRAEHLCRMVLQPGQVYLRDLITLPDLRALEQTEAYTLMSPHNEPLLCAGLIELWAGRAVAWACLSAQAGPYFTAIHRAVMRYLAGSPVRRIEATVDAGFGAGHRWLRMLGFVIEADIMRGYRPDGGDSALYARVRQ